MAGITIDLEYELKPETKAKKISEMYDMWNTARAPWRDEKSELRNYIFQTSTADTTNKVLPWKNSTATPKICQIRDNLHANYMAALFPNEEWLTWLGGNEESVSKKKRIVIEQYMRNKTEHSHFRTIVSQLVLDWIDYGNAFATTEYVSSVHVDDNGDTTVQYVGPKLVRISPFDIVFNPLAVDFDSSPKIIRSMKSLGDIQKDIATRPELGYQSQVFEKMFENRAMINSLPPDSIDVDKNDGFVVDGFGSISQYYSSGMVELLEFYGDFFDPDTSELYENHVITVADRNVVLRCQPIPGWNVNRIRHVGWRLRPDNLYAMGPLDNLVGMQYRIDHLENLKADVFDLIAHPVMKIKGYVEEFDYGPSERIVCGDDGDVSFMQPEVTALNADTQISILEQKMEDFAGAPKQAMGIRTPGEKTKFEIQTLENASGRIFQNKTGYFEQNFLELLLNDMLEISRRNMDGSDTIRILDDKINVVLFQTITKDDLKADGVLRPIGARHFATQANMLQNLVGFSNTPLGQDTAVNNHISGKKLARMIEELLGLGRFGLVEDNIRIFEQMDSQRLVNKAQETLEMEKATPSGTTADEM